ncbi:ATP-binding protein [uncultured Draconibacterium sp.]|uniref:ATP-binding protein n=1 Tax=uncultured Draconibacterium sp. TaxID=1573823 RepID=UPI0025E80BEA|nr:ATP-binding protein [uncultured Draconibacterium sp.]
MTKGKNKRFEELGINRWSLFFNDERTESKYREEYFNNSIYSFRLAFVIAILLYALFGVLDVYTSERFIKEFFTIRYLVVIPFLILVLAVSYFQLFKKIWQGFTLLAYIVGGSGIAIMLLLNPSNLYYYGGLFLIFIAGYFFIHLHYLFAISAGLLVIFCYNIAPFFSASLQHLSIEHQLISNTFFISANLIAAIALYNNQLVARTEFYQRMLLSLQQIRIKNINENLEKKVAERTELLNNNNKALKQEIDYRKSIEEKLLVAKEQAEESDRLKTAFLANMSHEIRTPMNGIIGFLDMIADPQISQNEREQYLDIVKQSGNRLLQTINDIVEISKIEAGELQENIAPVNIGDTFSYLNDFFAPKAQLKYLAIKFKNGFGDTTIMTDSNKLESILTNLINNAIKFTEYGSIEIGVTPQNDVLEFYVKDSGQGIPADRQKAIFDRFVQADLSLTRGHEGTGLGLSIAKAYTEALGGKIRLKSLPGKGTTFFFTIALVFGDHQTNVTRPELKNSPNAIPQENIRILVAEDDAVSFNLIRSILSPRKYEIIHAKNGHEAVQLFTEKHDEIALILMDLKMPKMDGIEATRRIRELNNTIPIIAQTAFALSGDKELALEAGCNDYLAKPIKRNELQNKISQFFTRKK